MSTETAKAKEKPPKPKKKDTLARDLLTLSRAVRNGEARTPDDGLVPSDLLATEGLIALLDCEATDLLDPAKSLDLTLEVFNESRGVWVTNVSCHINGGEHNQFDRFGNLLPAPTNGLALSPNVAAREYKGLKTRVVLTIPARTRRGENPNVTMNTGVKLSTFTV